MNKLCLQEICLETAVKIGLAEQHTDGLSYALFFYEYLSCYVKLYAMSVFAPERLRCEITKCGLLQNNQIDTLKDLAMILRGQIFQHSVCLIFGVAIML